MKLSRLLQKMPKRLYEQWEKHPAICHDRDKGRALADCLTDERVLRNMWDHLSQADRNMLCAVVRQRCFLPFTDADLEWIAGKQMSGAEARVGLLGLRRMGIIFTMKKMWGERVYVLPREMCVIWQKILFFEPIHSVLNGGIHSMAIADGEVIVHHHEERSLADRLFRLLSYAESKRLALTKKGTLHKRTIEELSKLLATDSQALSGMSLRYAHEDVYPVQLAVVLDMAIRIGCLDIREDHACMVIHRETLRRWLDSSQEKRNRELFGIWLEVYTPKEVWIQHAVAYINSMPEECWIPLDVFDHLLADIAPHDLPEDQNERDMRLMEEWLLPLTWFGRMRIGRAAASGRIVIKRVSTSAEVDEMYVQDDFEIILLPGFPFAARWDIERFAELVHDEETANYRLTKATVWDACERGYSSQRMIDLLHRYSVFDLPVHVVQSIEEWCGQFGKVTFADVRLLRAIDKRTADLVAEHPSIKNWLAARLNEVDFVVRAENHDQLVKLLKTMGCTPRTHIQNTLQHTDRADRQNGQIDQGEAEQQPIQHMAESSGKSAGIVYTTVSIPAYEWDEDVPDVRSAYPELEHIPSIWLREPRVYHASTGKQLLQKAIEWKAYVRLLLNGSDLRIAPQKLVEEQGDWAVIGEAENGELRLQSKGWQEMQLILPGINDKT